MVERLFNGLMRLFAHDIYIITQIFRYRGSFVRGMGGCVMDDDMMMSVLTTR